VGEGVGGEYMENPFLLPPYYIIVNHELLFLLYFIFGSKFGELVAKYFWVEK
jgi:hypothetical protein